MTGPDHPIADYEPMAATALTDVERWPLMDDAGRAMLARLREHPHAPRYNHACGDRLSAHDRDELRAYRSVLAGGHSPGEPAWVGDLIGRVYATVPRYARRGAAPDTLAEVPTVDRHDLLTRVAEHVPDDAPLDDVIVYRTSGSRGPAATVPMTPWFCALDLPVMQHLLDTLGVAPRGGAERVGLVNVYHQPTAYQFASVMSYFDGAGLVKINLHPSGWCAPDDVVSFLDDLAPELVVGNPISLAALADLPLRCTPRAVLSGAMALPAGLRSRLAARFGCPVVDLYGITEAGLIAWRTGDGPHLLLPRRVHVEILDSAGDPCPPGIVGEVTVTCGENALLPLLRYRTGDHAALVDTPRGPALSQLDGRAPVRFADARGHWVNSIEVTHLLSPLGIAAWTLHQRADRSLVLTLHTAGGPSTAMAQAALRGLLGDLPVAVTTADLAADAKPQRYSTDLADAAPR